MGSEYDSTTHYQTTAKKQRLSRAGQDRYRENGPQELRQRLQNMTEENLDIFRALRADIPEDCGEDQVDDDYEPNVLEIQDVLDGSTQINISHAGGEFVETLQDGLEEEMRRQKKSVPDYRDRRDRTQILVNGWDSQMERMVKAYMAWCAEANLGGAREETPRMVEDFSITVVDLYESSKVDVQLSVNGAGVPAALIKQGLVPYRLYFREQFSIAYDLYLELRRQTDALVNSALGRDAPDWRLKHTCPACMYKLKGEDALIFSMLTTMDGNDSLKRVLRHSKTDGSEEEPTLGPSKEREDSRDGGEDYFLSRDQVDKWAKGRVADILPTDANNPCSDQWKNMINDVTSWM
ncbi:hypothetical protein K438DRAFT_1787703 [Mycena galopus ATCC 62051]|nr:hypothetical protein K438DRAFT_1787703 [Mycena galopus ATCC 62051]